MKHLVFRRSITEYYSSQKAEWVKDFIPSKKEKNMKQWIQVALLVGSAVAAILFRVFYGVV
jgi:hypothetical protein